MTRSLQEQYLRVTVSKSKYAARAIRGLEFTIDIKNVLKLLEKQKGICALTGWTLEFSRGGIWNGKNPKGCTIDRIDSDLGYIPGNIQLACALPNVIKGTMTNCEFKKFWRANFC
jgi:hypothetical protein